MHYQSAGQVRGGKGLSSVELAASAVMMTVMVVLAVDLCVLMLGNQVIDQATRDAARAAAAQQTSANAINAAKAALAMHKTDGFFISQPKLTATVAPDFIYQDNYGTPYLSYIPAGYPGAGTQVNFIPFVQVTASVTVLLPASLSVLGVQLNQGPLTGGKMVFRRQYTFPIVKQGLNSKFG